MSDALPPEVATADETVKIFTDGACIGNPGPGGFAAILRYRGVEREISDGEAQTTNNRMELMAVIMGLESLKRPCRVEIFSDSRYVIDGMTKWMVGWQAKNWKNASKEPVKNQDLWQRLATAAAPHARSLGNGCAAIVAIPKMNAAINWRSRPPKRQRYREGTG